MVSLIDKHHKALMDLCEKYHVKRLDVFGSAARGDFDKSSDIDFLVEFDSLTVCSTHPTIINIFEIAAHREAMLAMTECKVEYGRGKPGNKLQG